MSSIANIKTKVTSNSFIFTLKDDHLYLKQKGQDKDLCLDLNVKVAAFDVFYDSSSETMRIAIGDENDNKNSLYITDLFKPQDFNWSNLKSLWHQYPLEDTKELTQVIVNSQGAAIATQDSNQNAQYYYFNNQSWTKYLLPEISSEIQDIAFGKVYGDDGIFLIYLVGNIQTLLFQSFIDPTYGKPSTYRFKHNQDIRSLLPVIGQDGHSILFASWDEGIFSFSDPDFSANNLFHTESDFLISDFDVIGKSDTRSIFALEHQDKQYVTDKTTHYNLDYVSDNFSNVKLCIVLK